MERSNPYSKPLLSDGVLVDDETLPAGLLTESEVTHFFYSKNEVFQLQHKRM